MKFNDNTIESINEKLTVDNFVYLRSSCDKTRVYADKDWKISSLCSVDEITQMIESLMELREAIETTTGVIL